MELTAEEQIQDLKSYLASQNKVIVESRRDGQCLLNSFKVALESRGKFVTINKLKEKLKSCTLNNLKFYKDFRDKSVDLIQELLLSLEEPMKYYSLSSIDLFPDVLGKAMCVKVTVYNIHMSV